MQMMTVFILLLNVSLQFYYAYIHTEPNPPANLTAMMTCGSQGYKIQIEWKVYSTDSKPAAQNDSHISSAGSSSCPTSFCTDWVSPPLPLL